MLSAAPPVGRRPEAFGIEALGFLVCGECIGDFSADPICPPGAFGFTNIPNNDPVDAAIGESQFMVDVTVAGDETRPKLAFNMRYMCNMLSNEFEAQPLGKAVCYVGVGV